MSTESTGVETPRDAPRLRRDAYTISLYGVFMSWGWFLYSFNPSVPLLAREFDISNAQAGLHGTASAVGTITAAMITPILVGARGRRTSLLLGCILAAFGTAGLVLGQGLPWTLGGVLVLALGMNIAISSAQVSLSLHHGSASSAAITEANGVGSSVGLLGPLAVGACVSIGWGWRPAVAVSALLVIATAVYHASATRKDMPLAPGVRDAVAGLDEVEEARPRAQVPAGAAAVVPGAPAVPAASVAARRRATIERWFLLTVVAAIALEHVTTYWATDLIIEQTGAGPGIATAATAGLVAGMSIIRFVVGPISLRIAPATLLAASFLVAIAGWAVLWTATVPGVALAGLFLAGLGYGAQYPLAIALVLRAAKGAVDKAQAKATLAGGLAIGVAPFALGALADQIGAHQAFLLVPVVAMMGFGAAVLGGRLSRTVL